MPLSPGHKLGSYEIVSALGAGGMGEVYRARDARLGRDVALKVLPPEVTKAAGRLERFDREARAIAALNHPHIVTIYSTEEADGIRFLTMELVDGCTLTDLVISSGMEVSRFLDIATPLADALAAAHQKQITHRDLKPGNVMVSNDGRVKVLDFGLARVGGAETGEQTLIETLAPITHQGMIVGTMPYMSPEQVEGRPIDARSDLFSLGVIFYELLSGERPFQGASSPALMSAILRDTPAGVGEKRTDVPGALDRLVGRLLEKRPEDRVQTARDVFNELRHIKGERATHVQRRFSDRSTSGNLTVAVHPFESRSSDEQSQGLGEGLREEIANGLSRFGYLRVLSGAAAASQARYGLGGQVRRAGQSIRVSVKLTDAQNGATLWAENFDGNAADDLFALQDGIASRVVATVGDQTGVLMRSIAAEIAEVPLDQLSNAELVIRFHAYHEDIRLDEHLRLRTAFEHALERDPRSVEGWACLAMLYEHEHAFGFNRLPNTRDRHRQAAERAVGLNPRSQHAWSAMATVYLFARDRAGVRVAADRVAALNPLNADLVTRTALFLSAAGEYERALALTNDAIARKPQHPTWYHFVPFNFYYSRGEDEAALLEVKRLGMPQMPMAQLAAAAVAAQLGLDAEARLALDAVRAIDPVFATAEAARQAWSSVMLDDAYLDRLVDGFEKALALCDHTLTAPVRVLPSRPSSSTSGTAATSGALSVAVLPFVPRSSDEESKSLADGLTDDITSGLSRFGYLRVLSRSIIERQAREQSAVHTQARYAIEGQVRRSGSTIRVGVTLVDTQTGTNLWTSSYDRNAGSGTFAIQDDVASAVVATIGDQTGVLMRAMARGIADRPLDQLTVGELVVRYHLYAESFDSAEHGRLRDALERALDREPRAAEGWACLAMLCEHEYGFHFNTKPEPLVRQRRAAERAQELDPRSQQAWIAMASVYNLARDREGLKAAVERAVGINPLNADLLALGAVFLSVAGEHDRASTLVTRARQLKPQHAGWYFFPLINAAYAAGGYEEALRHSKQVNMPRMPLSHLAVAATAGQLGRAVEAKAALAALRTLNPALGEVDGARAVWTMWIWSDEWIASMVDGFTKAKALERSDGRSDARSDDRSIAVLPFTDLSEKKDQDWFCDGIAEEIMNALAALPGLRVAARTSAFSFRGKADDLAVIGEKLNVSTVLDGSVRRSGDRVRITTRLSDTKLGTQLWSERFDREVTDIFDVQDEIARAIADRLRVTIDGGAERLVTKTTANMAAYELLLKGRAFLNRRGPAIYNAIPCFEEAIALDPNLADAHAGLGDTYRLFGIYSLMPTAEAVKLARASLERALAIDPDQVEALATLANITSALDWNYAEARQLTERALRRDPSHVRALGESAVTLAASMGERPSEALRQLILERIAKARSLDPLSAWAMAIEAMILVMLGRDQEAIEAAERAVATDPNNFTAQWSRVFTLAQQDRAAEVEEAARPGLAMSSRHPMLLMDLATVQARQGDVAGAESIYQELTKRSKAEFISPGARAVAAAAAGRMPEARMLLAQAIADHDALISFNKLAAFRPIWADPECAALLRHSPLLHNSPT